MHALIAASLYTGSLQCTLLVYKAVFANIGGLEAAEML